MSSTEFPPSFEPFLSETEVIRFLDRQEKTAYWTIVRDLDSGSVLHVVPGKDGAALRDFLIRLRNSKAKIEVVAMDMGKAFICWVKENLPSAQIVFDHFHVIKLMNEKVDLVRRRIAAKLDAEERAILKNQRFLLLRNEEDLNSEARVYLSKIKQTFQELADIHMMKETLRSIYAVAQNIFSGRTKIRVTGF